MPSYAIEYTYTISEMDIKVTFKNVHYGRTVHFVPYSSFGKFEA